MVKSLWRGPGYKDRKQREKRFLNPMMTLFKLFIWICVAGAIPTALCLALQGREDFDESTGFFHLFILIPGIAVSAGTLIYFLIQAILAVLYREAPGLTDEQLPKLTVIVPAYNEGAYVATTLESVLKCDYPAEKLEIIAVNDGSKDDTWEWIEKAVGQAGGRIKAINLPRNGGKKHALYAGISVATGTVVVTIDSDSEIMRDALKKIAAPFRHPKVGAVAGNIRVTNLAEGSIPKMLDVAFTFGFEFMRTAQSVVHSVLCTPGALSAYRLEAIQGLMHEWLEQTFMGQPANIGEDRAITSLLIRNGWYVDFQRDAMAFTKMPVHYKGLCKMLIRWCRSDVRENLGMSVFAFSRFRPWDLNLLAMQLNLIFASTSIVLPLFFLPMLVCSLVVSPQLTLLYTLSGSMLWSMLPALIYAARYSVKESIWAFIYGLYCIPFLSWISVYSLFTVRNSNWLTRNLPTRSHRSKVPLSQRIAYRTFRSLQHLRSIALPGK